MYRALQSPGKVLNKHVNKSIKLWPCGESPVTKIFRNIHVIPNRLNNHNHTICAILLATYYSGWNQFEMRVNRLESV